MRYLKVLAAVIFLATMAVGAKADNDQEDYNSYGGNAPHVDVWTNKGYNASYYFGEDLAVFFKADQDCYVVVYDVDPSGEVTVLYPNSMNGSTYVKADEVYRVPDINNDFKMEINGPSGNEHIYAVASYDYMNPPDFMKYIGYDYGNDQYYDPQYFVSHVNGNLNDFTDRIDSRIASGSYSVAHTRFLVDADYRNHQHYRYADYGPYDVGSVWVGAAWPGCEVWVDGIFYGIAPVLVPQVVIGYHWVWIYYGGYPCYQRYFYVNSHHRFDIDARFDSHFRDYRYRRDHFRNWVFEGKRYRNEPNFIEQTKPIRDKNIRTRELPPSVIRNYTDRGVLSHDSPLAKQVRSSTSDRTSRVITNQDNRPIQQDNRPIQTRQNPVKIDNRNRGDNRTGTVNRPNRTADEMPRVIVPEKPRAPQEAKPVVRDRSQGQGRQVEKHESSGHNYMNNQSSSKPSQSAPRENISKPSDNARQNISRQSEKPRQDSGNNGGSVERQKSSGNTNGGNIERQRSNGNEKGSSSEKESRTSGGKAARRK